MQSGCSPLKINYFFAQGTPQLSSVETVEYINTQMVPVIAWATNWGITSAFSMLGVALFYQVIITLVKPDK